MPGGSINGRPFREQSDSYCNTGIPCGNPRRYQTHSILRMGGDAQRHGPSSSSCIRTVGPVEDIETESDRQLQQLVRKQLNTNISIRQHMQQHKIFSEAVSYKPATDDIVGVVPLKIYQDLARQDSYVQDLKHYGLTTEEIRLKLSSLQQESICSPAKKSCRVEVNPEMHSKQLEEIDRKIMSKNKELKEPDKFSGAKYMSRHEMDLEKAISHDKKKDRVLNCLITTEKDSGAGVLNSCINPMDQLPDILNSVMERVEEKTEMIRKNKRKQRTKNRCISTVEGDAYVENCVDRLGVKEFTPSMLCDRVNGPESSESNIINTYHKHTADSRCQNPDTSSVTDTSLEHLDISSNEFIGPLLPDGKISEVGHDSVSHVIACVDKDSERNTRVQIKAIEHIPREVLIRYRLSKEEIRELPRFKDYQPGEPSEVLYLKNVSSKVTEEDLATVFLRFDRDDSTSKITIKLMTGRMRGQAFITFDSAQTAQEALQLANGFDLKGKPLVIQYGHKPAK